MKLTTMPRATGTSMPGERAARPCQAARKMGPEEKRSTGTVITRLAMLRSRSRSQSSEPSWSA